MMTSLRARLFVGLAVLVLAMGLAAGGLTFRWAFQEAIELQDAILLQIGMLAVKNHFRPELIPLSGVDAESRVAIEELDGAPASGQDGISLPSLPANLPDGLQTISRGHKQWRVLLRSRPDGSRVAIGQLTAARDEIARGSALRAVLPLCALIPCLMFLVAIVVHHSFRPVAQLAAQLDAKQSGHLQKLPMDGMPGELRPFIASINRLLERIGVMFDHQRRFIADAAHELRTPITALSIQAENLDSANLPEGSRDRLTVLKSGIRRTAHLLEQLLALAKYEAGNASNAPIVALDQIVKSVVADVLPLAQGRSIDLGFEHIDHAPVRVESTGLTVLLRNLIDNAIRYSFEGGRIDISVLSQGDEAILLIEDNGPGIPEPDLDRIFEPFYRGSRPEGDGTGLGLSIVRRIVGSYNGSIGVENVVLPDRSGLRVTVRFPLA
jgi:two-component system OmpR family sensor kinase